MIEILWLVWQSRSRLLGNLIRLPLSMEVSTLVRTLDRKFRWSKWWLTLRKRRNWMPMNSGKVSMSKSMAISEILASCDHFWTKYLIIHRIHRSLPRSMKVKVPTKILNKVMMAQKDQDKAKRRFQHANLSSNSFWKRATINSKKNSLSPKQPIPLLIA